ncbi:hypothetical protein [Paraburkholderia caribensis]|uniref:hypothetical protein n=1 Tax=Paraburkholderia caribensis TaxID=75105 RepID=UPI001CAC48BD|nr:hypothetical protein [Paraburkholderia caribensis]CAG9244935.1 conserved hypothetical protein [Paraburkholderia caribensis]
MRRVIARQSKVQSHPLDFIGIPKAVLAGLNTKTDDYGTACRIGAECAADLVAAFQANPYLIGTSRLLAIARYIETHDCSPGIDAGFFNAIDKLIVRGAQSDAGLAKTVLRGIQPASKSAAKEAHERRTGA